MTLQPHLPQPVAALAAQLALLPATIAVTLGGSRAVGTERPDSDWDLLLYYRGTQRPLDPADIGALGHYGSISELGALGPVVNGGAFLTIGGTSIDVLFRDLDVIEGWRDEAQHGRFDVLAQRGSIVGAPTYSPVGELALCISLAGGVPRPSYSEALAVSASPRWDTRGRVSLAFAQTHAETADTACCCGMLIDAALSFAHARLAERREWVLSEKRLIQRAGLERVQPLLATPGATSTELTATVAAVGAILGAQPWHRNMSARDRTQ